MVGWNVVPSNWLHNCFKKISVLFFSELFYEFNCCAFYSVYENELYVVVMNLLAAFMLF
jgi:hypothetical protein